MFENKNTVRGEKRIRNARERRAKAGLELRMCSECKVWIELCAMRMFFADGSMMCSQCAIASGRCDN